MVEIKHDDDQGEETRAKQNFGASHFGSLNQRLRQTNPIDLKPEFRDSVNQIYAFTLLRPNEYSGWFSRLRTGLIVFDVRVPHDDSEKPVNEIGETAEEVVDNMRSVVREDWGENVLPMELMEALLAKINRDGPDTKIPFAEVAELLGHEVPDKETEEAALYLSSNRVGMLNLVCEWIHEDGSSERLASSDVYDALRAGTMRNPRTGTDDNGFKSNIWLSFEPAKEVMGRKNG